jgi:DNA invertase Pin-like site-specific DNA recombinase
MSNYRKVGRKHGEQHHRAKLSDAAVAAIRQEYAPNEVGYATLARKYGCGVSTVRDLVNHYTRPDFSEAS